jgi:hypothetical protein
MSDYPQRTPVPQEFANTAPTATQPQITFICDLLDKRNLLAWPQWFDATNAMDREEYAAHIAHYKTSVVPQMTKKRASELISHLQSLPWLPRQERPATKREMSPQPGTTFQQSPAVAVTFEQIQTDDGKTREFGIIKHKDAERGVLSGSYGVDTSNDSRYSNDTSFFKVWANREYGRGWGVQLYVSDDTRRVRLSYEAQVDAIKRIAADPDAASRLFGLEFKRCGVCGRGLTNDISRELGIGPVCRERVGRY